MAREPSTKDRNVQGLFRQQRQAWPVPKEDSTGSLEEGMRRAGRSMGPLLTAGPGVSLGGWCL